MWNKYQSKKVEYLPCHALTTTDIFLFNVGKAQTFDEVDYEVLEEWKNSCIKV